MTHDLEAAAREVASSAEQLACLVRDPALPAIIQARTLIVLDRMRSDLAGTIQAVSDAVALPLERRRDGQTGFSDGK